MLAAAILLVLPAAPGQAGALVPPDPWEVIHTVRAFGPAEVGRDPLGDPLIDAGINGPADAPLTLRYTVAFYGCHLGRDCTTILFVARLEREDWAEAPPAPESFAAWNREKLIGRAWFDERHRAVLEHPVVMAHGLPEETLRASVAAWIDALREYAEYLGIPES